MVFVLAKLFLTCFLVKLVWTQKPGHFQQNPHVSQFFENAGQVVNSDEESRRRERLLGQEIGGSIVELVDIVVESFGYLTQMMPLGRIGLTDLNFEWSSPLLQTVSTVLTGTFLAVFWPSAAMFGTMVYYVLAAASSLLTILHRLYSDEGYLVTAARRFGLEAGQGLLEEDIVDNLSTGLETARGAYNFLADLS